MVERKDVEAALEARRELGPQYEADIVDSLVAKIEKRLDERAPAAPVQHVDLRLPLGSMALGVAATAIVVGNHAAWLAAIIWVAIAVINGVYARGRRL